MVKIKSEAVEFMEQPVIKLPKIDTIFEAKKSAELSKKLATEKLEKFYAKCEYPSKKQKIQLAANTKQPLAWITQWFNQKRYKVSLEVYQRLILQRPQSACLF
jgi:hypothetical protein